MPMHPVARLADLPTDRGVAVKAGAVEILLIREAQSVRAFQAQCPHAQAPLADGALCNGRLICPWHKAVFDVSDGHLCEPPALEGLKRYAVRIENGTVLVNDQADDPPQTAATARGTANAGATYVLIGGGAAGTAAASALRERGYAGRLVMIDPQTEPGYDRTALSKFVIAGQMAVSALPPLRDEAFYETQRIERLQTAVSHLDPEQQLIELEDGTTLPYDCALIATGGEPVLPDWPGVALQHVWPLRSREDARHILEGTLPGTRAVVVGDSFIGLEAASALRARGLTVTVIARHEVPFARQFGETLGRALRDLHERHGVVFQTGVEVAALLGDTRVEGVRLANGERVAAELVLLGLGVKPATQFLDAAWLTEDGEVAVNERLQLTDSLWAAGDIARFMLHGAPARIEHWRVAEQLGRIAAADMLGEVLEYEGVPFFWTQQHGQRIDYLGHASEWDEEHIIGDLRAFHFIALLCRRGQVAAVVGCNHEAACALLAERLKAPLSVDEALELIQQEETRHDA